VDLLHGLSETPSGLVSASDRGRIGEMIFQFFVAATTEQNIKEKRIFVTLNIFFFCTHPENAKFCQPPEKIK
jgi:hypothetical protein